MKKSISIMLKATVSVLLITALLYKVGFAPLIETFKRIPVLVIFLFTLNYLISIFIGAVNIKLLMDPIKKIPLIRLIKYSFLSWSFGLVSPGKLGEFSILFFLKKNERVNYGPGLAVALLDKIITVVSLIAISSLFIVLFLPNVTIIKTIPLFLLAIIIIFYVILSDRVRGLIKKYALKGYAKNFSKFNKTFRLLIFKRYFRVYTNLILTIIKWFLPALFVYIALIYLGESITLFNTFVISSFSILVSIIPISLSGLGVREATFVGLMSWFGVSKDISFSLSLLSLIIAYLLAAVSVIAIRTNLKIKNK